MNSIQRTYSVAGMTCEHCKVSVTREISKVAGVESVAVDLVTGRVDVRGSGFDDGDIEAAVAEAGYEVAP